MEGSRSLFHPAETLTFPVSMWVLIMLLLFATSVSRVHSKVYIVRTNGSPVVHYNGSIPGYPATAATNGTKLNCTSEAYRKYVAYLETSHDRMLANAFPNGGYSKLYSYTVLVSGFAVDIPESEADKLAKDPSILTVESDGRAEKATTYTPQYLGLPGGAWAQNGGVSNAGEDIVIGLVDTGVNPAHPSFANDESKPYGPLESFTGSCEVGKGFPAGSCNHKLIGARHFSASANASGLFNASTGYDSPFDDNGHGTHTASTAGGNNGVPVIVNGLYFGQASGIAPRARVAIYKALYGGRGTFADIGAAIEQAVADGVDILSLSLAPILPPLEGLVYFSIFDEALLGAVTAGIFVVQAAGNSGPSTESIQSWSPWIVSAAASYTDRNYINSITLGNGKTLTGSGIAVGTSDYHTMVLATDVNISSNPNISVDTCLSSDFYDRELVQGNFLVCNYGNGYKRLVTETALNLSAAGVIYVAVDPFTQRDEVFPMLLTTHQLPAIYISSSDAVKDFFKYYNHSTKSGHDSGRHHHHNSTKKFGATAKINGGIVATFTGKPPVVAYFSSRGPDINDISYVPSDVLKPNVMAPGVAIWAGWSPLGGNKETFYGQSFAIVSGTSMATPHVAGIAALVKEKNPTFSPAAIHSALAGTAFSVDKAGASLRAEDLEDYEDYDYELEPATPFDLGSGQVDALAALDPGLIFEAGIDDYRRFLCLSPTANSSQVLNATGKGCPDALNGYPSDLNAPNIAVGVLEGARVVPRTVTSVSKRKESYSLKVKSPKNVTARVLPTSFTISPGHSQSLWVTLTAKFVTNVSAFGQLQLYGNRGHLINIPIAVGQTII